MSRALRAVAVVAVLGLVPAVAADASHVAVRDTADACARAPEDGFTDTGPDGSATEEAVDCLTWYGVTSGVDATRYAPERPVERQHMATMLAATMRASEATLAEPPPGQDAFADDDGSVHEHSIDYLALHEVAAGVGERRFAPARAVTRGQLATFVVRQLRAVGAVLPEPAHDHFDDDDGDPHEGSIDRLAELGVAAGAAPRTYRPGAPVTRGQMAQLVARDLDVLVEQGRLLPPDRRGARIRVSLDRLAVEAGGTLSGLVASEHGIASARASGCGLDRRALTDRDVDEPGIRFAVALPAGQPPGACTISVTAEL